MQMSQSRSFGSGPWSLNRSLGKGCTKAKLEEMRREDKKRLNMLLLLLLFALNTQSELTRAQYILISLI